MASVTMSNGAGMDVELPEIRRPGRFALSALFGLPLKIREKLLFGSSLSVPLQKSIVHLLGGTYSVKTTFTDGPMRGRAFICSTAEKYFYLGSYLESDVQKVFLERLQSGHVCYDVGGHAGYMSLLFSAIVGPTGRVFCFEPSPINYARVQQNVKLNPAENLTVLNFGASDREGEAILEERGTMSAIVCTPEGTSGASKIRIIRLDDFVYRDGNPPPSFIKVDVEGHAGFALQGAHRIFERARPTLVCEIHSDEEQNHVSSFLSSYNYDSYPIERGDQFPTHIISCPR